MQITARHPLAIAVWPPDESLAFGIVDPARHPGIATLHRLSDVAMTAVGAMFWAAIVVALLQPV